MRTTLNEAIDVIFGTDSGDPGTGPDDPVQVDGTVAELLQQAEDAFNAADAALRAGDLARYAEQVDAAQELIAQALALIAENETNG
jgi:hypothetical protein